MIVQMSSWKDMGYKKKHQLIVHNNQGQLEPFVKYANILDDTTQSATCGSTQKTLNIQLESKHSG